MVTIKGFVLFLKSASQIFYDEMMIIIHTPSYITHEPRLKITRDISWDLFYFQGLTKLIVG